MVDVPEVDWIKMHPERNLEIISRQAAKSATKCYRNLAIRDTKKNATLEFGSTPKWK